MSTERRILIITDIHGCLDECRKLLAALRFNEEEDVLINLGDTIDRGPQIYETFEFLRGLKERMGDRLVLIRGNHEQMMLDATDKNGPDRKSYKDLWYMNSGEKTVYSFVNHKHKIQEYREWYDSMPFYYQNDRFICVHASLTDEDPQKNTAETMIWGRDTSYGGKLVMTGHTPYKSPMYFRGDGAYAVLETGKKYYLEKTGMMALDTGCVFGYSLTGMAIEGDLFYLESIKSNVKK